MYIFFDESLLIRRYAIKNYGIVCIMYDYKLE